MGFGTLFIGYFLLLNVTNYNFTDIICASVMALALYKLSGVNRDFKLGLYSAYAFIPFALFELIIAVTYMFSPSGALDLILPYASMVRYIIIFVISLFILRGISEVANEVGLNALSKKAYVSVFFCIAVYSLLLVFELPIISAFIKSELALGIITLTLLVGEFVLVAVNLVTIYTSYMRICMPEDIDNDVEDKPSKFEFVNKFREKRAEKSREYAEYKLEKMQKKINKSKKKKKR